MRAASTGPRRVTVVEKAARDLRLTFPQDIVRLSLPQIAPSSDFFPGAGHAQG